MRSHLFFFLLALLILPSLSYRCEAQTQSPDKADGRLVMLTVTVRSKSGEYLMGLKRDAFTIVDEKQTRSISFFNSSDTPASVIVLFDTSGSMEIQNNRDLTRAKSLLDALSELVRIGNPGNEYVVGAFDRGVGFFPDWKSRGDLLRENIELPVQKRGTALFDACWSAIDKMQSAHHARKALVVISDGVDNESQHSFKELRDSLRAFDIIFYGIGVYQRGDASSLSSEGRSILKELSEVNGGQLYLPESPKEMALSMNMLANRLRHQYRIGFQPDAGGPARKWRKLKVSVALPADVPEDLKKLTIQTRQGYYTP